MPSFVIRNKIVALVLKNITHIYISVCVVLAGGAGNEVCDCIFFKVHRNSWVTTRRLADVPCSADISTRLDLPHLLLLLWSYVMSVGHDRKIDIYSVSMSAKMWAWRVICQLRLESRVQLLFFSPFLSHSLDSFIVFTSHFHLTRQLTDSAGGLSYLKPDLNTNKITVTF